MGARGDLGDDAAIGPVRRLLPGQPVGEDAPVARSTSAAAVSSQLDSMPRIRLIAAFPATCRAR